MNVRRRIEILQHRYARICLAVLLTIQTGMLAWIALENSPVTDEIGHLPAGLSHWRFQKFDLYRVNPPLVRSLAAVPVLFSDCLENWQKLRSAPLEREEIDVGRGFVAANGSRFFYHVSIARLACIPLCLLGTVVCYRWGRELGGRRAGLFSAAMWVFSPNLLAHGSLITPDAAAAATGVLAAYMFWRWLRQPTAAAALIAGVAAGLAVLTKSTWLILFGLWPALFVAGCLVRSDLTMRTHSRQLCGMLLTGLYVLNGGYLFQGSMTPLGNYQFRSRALAGEAQDDEGECRSGNRFAQSVLKHMPVPLPRSFVEGIDLQKYDMETGQPSYVRGEWRNHGQSWYYLYALAVKVPLGTLVIGGLSVLTAIICVVRTRTLRAEYLALLLPPLSVLLLVSSQTGLNKHLRYVLPVLPFAFVAVSAVLRRLKSKRARNLRLVFSVMLLWSAGSSIAVCPWNLAYFNEIAGGPENGAKHLLGSNLDWGQSLIALDRWNRARADSKPLYVSYSGLFDPSDVGIFCRPVSGNDTPPSGWYAISMNRLHGYEQLPRVFRERRPDTVLGYSMAIFLIE